MVLYIDVMKMQSGLTGVVHLNWFWCWYSLGVWYVDQQTDRTSVDEFKTLSVDTCVHFHSLLCKQASKLVSGSGTFTGVCH